MRTRLAVFALALCVLAAAPASASARSVPQGFVGMVAEGPTLDPKEVNLGHEMNVMVKSGVESLRVVFDWADEQPFPNDQAVPDSQKSRYHDEAGVPTNFDFSDRIVALAAVHHLPVLPVIWRAPPWAARFPKGDQASPPSGVDPMANFSGALVRRYGPTGSFWTEHPQLPRMPIRLWQVWNEPNITLFWDAQPFAPDYVALLRGVRTQILANDPGAKIVLGGLTNDSWNGLQHIYDEGGRGLFDYVAAHPFTKRVPGVITILRKLRAVMARNGDGAMPLMVTELSWPSARGKVPKRILLGFEVNPVQQAQRVRAAYALLAKWRVRLNLIQVDWYSWLRFDQARDQVFDFAGLRHKQFKRNGKGRITDKPALGAFKMEALRLEGCRRKGPLATDCRHR
jgi:hypothetical protein